MLLYKPINIQLCNMTNFQKIIVGSSVTFMSGIQYCDVHAVVLFRGSKGRYLVTTRHRTMDVSLESVPRTCLLYGLSPGYISRTMRQQSE
jgi:hypothetical protein